MIVVIDTNIFMSSLFKNGDHFRNIIYSKSIEICSPNFLFLEVLKHKDKLLKYSGLDESNMLEVLYSLLQHITFINESLLSNDNKLKAFHLCKDTDPKDAPFVAIALELDALLWTGDKRLKEGLKAKGFDRFFEV